ncbi:hydroxylamine reductase, partial [Dysgonomonas sp. 520]|nr:hydroxylamine reductase [Dysgonomonas sp. 520]
MNMFCYQCQETAQNKGCTVKGVCGKTSDVANLQDLLIFLLKGISRYTVEMRKKGIEVSAQTNHFVMESLFMTITNANFDKERFVTRIQEAIALRDELAREAGNITADCDCMTWRGSSSDEMEAKAATVGILATKNEDIRSLCELLIYGLKGMA